MEAEGMLGHGLLTKDTTCGIGCLKGQTLQRLANSKNYVFLYGLLGCIFSASYAYSGGIFTTIEKRFKIQSQTMGLVTVGNDFSQILVLALFSYYIGKGHRPRWLAVGIYSVVLFCFMNASLYFFYGAGQDALELTYEYGRDNATRLAEDKRHLCQAESEVTCDSSTAEIGPLVILFLAQLISGFGGSLYHTLGVSYMDDNIQKSKIPALISVSYFIKMLGPVVGYGLAAVCLNMYISPTLTPRIDTKDPRWVGAFWIGWLVLGFALFVCASLIGLFPKVLPKAAQRNLQTEKKEAVEEMPSTVQGMIDAFRRLLKNKVLICKSISGVFYVLGYIPYWIYMPKYIEVIYRQSAARANLITGSVGLICSACGTLTSGMVISKFKPQARTLSMWNIIVKSTTVLGFIAYANLGCPKIETQGTVLPSGELNATFACNADCHCEFVKYSPICAYGKTYISPCHAGCNIAQVLQNGTQIYTNCSCVDAVDSRGQLLPQTASSGICPVDCLDKFYTFLGIVCLLKLVGATSQTSNFLISMRSVEEQDKTVALGLGLTMITLFGLVPGPVLYGYIIDTTCLVWGKTCSSKGNCWLYDGEALKFLINVIGISFLLIGLFFAFGAWYYVKGVQLFDDEPEKSKHEYLQVNMTENIFDVEEKEIKDSDVI